METKKIIIGLTGPLSGGKGTMAEILKEKGFFCTSLSDRIREEIVFRGGEITRENLQNVADGLRQEFGPQILAERSWKTVASQSGNSVIESIRSIGEVDFLKRKPGFVLIGVTAPREVRYRRTVERTRVGDPLSWEEFVRLDKKDFKSGKDGNGRDIEACLKKSDYLIENTGTVGELNLAVDKILKKILN